jgi:uncharacterized protein YjiS (DUF1127 family)
MTWPRMTWHRLWFLVREWRRRARSRREIGKLDDSVLRDLGVSRGQMRFEAQKPFWRA